jgi:hypothetical protein
LDLRPHPADNNLSPNERDRTQDTPRDRIPISKLSSLQQHIAAAALASTGIPLDDVRRHFRTVGGINEQYYAAFRDRGGVAALEADAVLERVRATETTLDGGAP